MTEAQDKSEWPIGNTLAVGRRVLNEEARALTRASDHLGTEFEDSVKEILRCRGRVIVSGIGKSGHVGRKVAATFASTGTPSFFVHAAEAGHGDLGMITEDDIVLAISNSGESEEVINIASFAKRFGAKIIAMTKSHTTSVGRLAQIHLNCSVQSEACPLGVAPTSSTTLQLALGDALAMATLAARGFTREDFARTHPFGQLGRRYYLRVRDVMHPIEAMPKAEPTSRLVDVIPLMASGRTGAVIVLSSGALLGIFTDSDLRRLVTKYTNEVGSKLLEPVSNFIVSTPLCIDTEQLASEALNVFEQKKVSRLVCVEGTTVRGLLGWHDLLQHKVA